MQFQVRVLQGFDKEFRNKLGSTLGDANPKSKDNSEELAIQCNVNDITSSTNFLPDAEKPMGRSSTFNKNVQSADVILPQNISYKEQSQTYDEPSLLNRKPSMNEAQMTPLPSPKSEYLWKEDATDVANKVGSTSSTIVIKKPINLSRPNNDGKSISDDPVRTMNELKMGLKMLRRMISKKDIVSAKVLAKQVHSKKFKMFSIPLI